MLEGFLSSDSWKNRRVTVMGLGRFGGGAGVTRFLVQRGAIVTLTDLASEADLLDSLKSLEPYRPSRLVLGRHEERDFREAELIVVNPAVKPGNPFLQIAKDAGVPLTSEMNLFWQLHRGKTVAVTGSNGKSTTAAMIHKILEAAGFQSRLGGNIGRSLLEEVDEIRPSDWTVLELSSFQLVGLGEIEAAPHVAVVTNFSPNHLDWHGSIENYREAKQSVIKFQTPEDTAVLNVDDPEVFDWPTSARKIGFGEKDTGGEGVFAISPGPDDWLVRMTNIEEVIPMGEWLQIPGHHNQQNAAAAIAAAILAGANLDASETALKSFMGLPHRLEFVIETAGRRFYNDSIATTPESAEMALRAFSEPIILLAGGSDKGTDLSDFARQIAGRVKAVALLGTTGPVIQKQLEATEFPQKMARVCHSLEEAVRWAGDQSQAGDVILLSPGCASYDWFQNFADRGEQFSKFAKSWKPSDGTVPSNR